MFHLPIVEIVVAVIIAVLNAGGLAGLAALMAVESFGIPPIPSEVILLFAGFLIATGSFSWPGAFLAALAGGVGGSYLGYWVGRDARGWLFPQGRSPRVPLDPRHLEQMDRWFERHGEGTVAFSRLVPIIRSYVSYPAGAARMSPLKFGVFTALGATPFTLVLLYGGYVLGSNWSSVVPYFSLLDDAALVVLAAALVYLILVWKNVLSSGFPPRLIRSIGSPPPVEGPRP
ncbi:MAG: DedA family protein [Thermoplasmata archaeon]|nr:DedA family protein [Thermoplasmata archaeon]MCI4359219.1 DedA family protein [Thermoplasmata archaeon]